jgi:3-phosphoshikimate 1-carboxyvinyltransferase
MVEIHPAREPIVATLTLPGSKSYTNRALLVAALADGESRLTGALFSEDTEHMVACLNDLGLRVQGEQASQTMVVSGRGGEIPVPDATLYCGNAGTAARFLLAMLTLGRGRYTVDGNQRMRERPQGPLLAALRALGCRLASVFDNDCLPVRIDAEGCPGGEVTMDGALSSQYFTALALAAPHMPRGIAVEVAGELVSQPYLDMTADVMRAFGVELANDAYRRFTVAPGQHYRATEYAVEPDASAASYFYAAAALTGGSVTVRGLTRASRQGDLAFVDVLAQMGCTVSDGPDGVTVTGPERLHGVTVDMNALSDTALTLAALAPFADSPTEVRNIAHVRRQESDRIAAAATELARLGVAVTEYPDGWRIEPGAPSAGAVETYDDHRLAMSFALIGLKTPGLRIRGPECVRKTFPGFFARWAALTAPGLA